MCGIFVNKIQFFPVFFIIHFHKKIFYKISNFFQKKNLTIKYLHKFIMFFNNSLDSLVGRLFSRSLVVFMILDIFEMSKKTNSKILLKKKENCLSIKLNKYLF